MIGGQLSVVSGQSSVTSDQSSVVSGQLPVIRHRQCGGRGGSALIVVLWTVGLLSMLVGAFAFDAHVESRITSYYRKRTKASYLARAGVEMAEMLMEASGDLQRGQEKTSEDEDDAWFDAKMTLVEGAAIRGLEHELGDGTIVLDVIPEPARRDVNHLTVDDWERILEVGGVPEDLWPELIDSFFDWTDKDDAPRADGAESEDYYLTLAEPYRANDGPLNTVEELLLVKGFTNSILSGGTILLNSDEEPIYISGIGDLLTTFGDENRININAATKRVLMTLPEVDDLVANAILEEREGWLDESGKKEDTSFQNVDDFFARIPGLNPEIKKYVSIDSAIYRIRAVGTVFGVSREIRCIVKYSGKNLTVLRWQEEE